MPKWAVRYATYNKLKKLVRDLVDKLQETERILADKILFLGELNQKKQLKEEETEDFKKQIIIEKEKKTKEVAELEIKLKKAEKDLAELNQKIIDFQQEMINLLKGLLSSKFVAQSKHEFDLISKSENEKSSGKESDSFSQDLQEELEEYRKNVNSLKNLVNNSQIHLGVNDLNQLPILPQGQNLTTLVDFFNNNVGSGNESMKKKYQNGELEFSSELETYLLVRELTKQEVGEFFREKGFKDDIFQIATIENGRKIFEAMVNVLAAEKFLENVKGFCHYDESIKDFLSMLERDFETLDFSWSKNEKSHYFCSLINESYITSLRGKLIKVKEEINSQRLISMSVVENR